MSILLPREFSEPASPLPGWRGMLPWVKLGYDLSNAWQEAAVEHSIAWNAACLEALGSTFPGNTLREKIEQNTRLLNFPFDIHRAYDNAKAAERVGSAPLREPLPDFSAFLRRHPRAEIWHEILADFPSVRVSHIVHPGADANTPNIVEVVQNSGNTADKGLGTAEAFYAIGHVRLVQHREPRYVDNAVRIDLNHSATAVASVIKAQTGRSWVIGTSQAGIVSMLAASRVADRLAGLIVIGSPVHPQIAPGFTSLAARYITQDPEFIRIADAYPGAGRSVLPGAVMKVMFTLAGESCGHNDQQNLPAELISGEAGMLDWFRRAQLTKGTCVRLGNQTYDLSAIMAAVIMVIAKQDLIVNPRQTLHLHLATPNALSHDVVEIEGGHYDLLKTRVLEDSVLPVVNKREAFMSARLMPTPRPMALAS
jgi:pimeloyl-ACP methyl ester carboxylesterase